MKDMYTLLKGMEDTLFAESPNEDISELPKNTPPIFDEFISNEMAKELLEPGDYEDQYSYKLITTMEGFVVEKFDKERNKVIAEYEINTDEEVQSFEEMRKSAILGDYSLSVPMRVPGDYRTFDDGSIDMSDSKIEDDAKTSHTMAYILIALFVLLIGISIGLHIFVGSL